jgi:hypothetical protein
VSERTSSDDRRRRLLFALLSSTALGVGCDSDTPQSGKPAVSPTPVSPPPALPPPPRVGPTVWPLSVHASGRYLIDAVGAPFFIHGQAPWSLATNLTRSDIVYYLDDRLAKGFNAIVFELIEHWFTSQIPRYRNKEGNDPF